MISPLSEANLLLFGLAVDDDPRPLASSYGPGETLGDDPMMSITFTLQDGAGRPAPAAALAWTARGPRIRVDFPPFPVNAQGQVTIEAPRRFIREIDYKASAADGNSASGELKRDSSGAFPTQPVLKLAPAPGGLTSQVSPE